MTRKRKQKDQKSGNFPLFMMVAIAIMVLLDQFVFSGERPYMQAVKEQGLFKQDKLVVTAPPPESLLAPAPQTMTSKSDEPVKEEKPAKKAVTKKPEQILPELKTEDTSSIDTSFLMPEKGIKVYEVELPESRPLWKKNAVPSHPPAGWPRIAILIDDMGVDEKRSLQATRLRGPLTLAILPYANKAEKFAYAGHQAGHELMIHMPMEPMNGKLDMGKIYLDSSMSPSDFDDMMRKAFASFGGYVGINNHMGSKLTQDSTYMNMLMKKLDRRGLLFVDSRTINSSVAADIAAEYGVPYAVRDVFLDHEPTLEFVRKSLEKLEYVARYNGYAVAIGHPKDATIQALKEWLPTLKEKKIALVPISQIVKEKEVNRLSSSLLDAPAKTSAPPQPE